MITQPDLFAGKTYDPAQDEERLKTQLGRVYRCLRGMAYPPQWWTLAQLARGARGSEAAVSARIRDLRKRKFGGYTIERRRRGGSGGTWEYRMEI